MYILCEVYQVSQCIVYLGYVKIDLIVYTCYIILLVKHYITCLWFVYEVSTCNINNNI